VTSISADHPSLAGHFPGRPVVPGVVLLQEVLEAVRMALPAESVVTGFPVVKFSSPLKPDERVTIELEGDATAQAAFSCRVDQRLIASGVIEFAPRAAHVEGA
jgi:3-hydroxymyristoyl/3-hydroxydecanoyl-(acyl carrier protein) dehydratase